MERHLSQAEWVRLLADHVAESEADAAAAHLPSCRPCWDGAARAVAELKRRGIRLRFQDVRSSIVGVLESEEKVALRWLLAQTSWAARLRNLDAGRQVKRLKADSTLWTREMLDTVLAEATTVAPDDPWLGEEWAQVAHALAGFLPENVCPKPLREDLQGAAMLIVANSRRLAADWSGSAVAVETARHHFEKGTGEPTREARLLSIQASLASDTGHLDRALALLDRAIESGRRTQEPAVFAALAVQRASILLAAFRYEEAVIRAEEALSLLAPGETRLEMLARSIVIECFVFLERPGDALRCFSAILPLYEKLPGRLIELQRGYLEALLLDSFGFARDAEKAFRANVAGFMAAEQYKDAFLIFLTYFESLIRKGLLDKAESACAEAVGLTKQAGSGCHGQMIDLWQGLLTLLQTRRLVNHHLVEAREYLVRSWHAPAAQGPLRQTARVGIHLSTVRQELEEPRAVPDGYESLPVRKAEPTPETTACGYREEMERLDRELITRGLAQCGGRIREAALLLGIARDTLRAKIRKYALKAAGPDGPPLPAGGPQEDSLPEEEQYALLAGMRARACWTELAGLPAEHQIRRFETVVSLRTLEMLGAVLIAARSGAQEEPNLGEQRARVAHTLAGLLEPGDCPPRRKADLQSEAMLIAANCRRLAGDFAGSAAALDAALQHLGHGTGDVAQQARLLSLQASLATDTGHTEEALSLLDRAASVCRRTGAAAASIAIQEASILLTAFRYEAAVDRAEAALQLLGPGDTRLELLARSIITESLVQLGRGDEALRNLFNSRALYQRLRGHLTDLQFGYLKALVLDSLGFAREAEDAFRVNIAGWLEADRYKDALLILLTQFERLHRKGDLEGAKRVGRDALRLFEEAEPDRHAQVIELWRNLLSLVESQGLTDHKLLEARDFAMAAFAKRPAPEPEPPAPIPVPADRLLHVEPAAPVGNLAPGDYKQALRHRDRQLIAAALAQCHGHLSQTSRLLGISEPTLRDKIWRYRLKRQG
jgi:tetratricopeptide (TPR) repeat protein